MPPNHVERPLLDRVDEGFERQIDFLCQLVETNSYTGHKSGVDDVAEQVAERLVALGLGHRREPREAVGDFHRFDTAASLDAPVKGSRLALIGHLDTVFPPDSPFQHLERLDDGRLTGPGVLDMKGGLDVAVCALEALGPDRLHQLPLRVLLNSDEEIGSPHSRPWIEAQAGDLEAALVLEGGRDGDDIVTRRKGTGRLLVETLGRSAHAGNHHRDGVNAIIQLAHVCVALSELTDYERGRTVNVGQIAGGIAKNVVPERATAQVDVRYLVPDDADVIRRRVEAIAAKAYVEGASTAVRVELARPPMAATEASLALMARYLEAAHEVGLGGGEAPLQGGGSDANLVAHQGVPVIDGLGPYGKGFHTPTEWIAVESLRLKTKALALFLSRWLGGG
jgi:glutamate carboxypeptidase